MSTVESIEAEIRRKARRDAKVDRELDEFARRVQTAWRANSPVDTGNYASKVVVQNRRDVDGMPAKRVVAKAWYAHLVEFGTGPDAKRADDAPGSPNTPTRAAAPRAKTAAQFGGDESPADGFAPIEAG